MPSMPDTCFITGGAGNLACQLTHLLAEQFDRLVLFDLATQPVAEVAEHEGVSWATLHEELAGPPD